ncbi:MAG: MarR family transcriptional regulator [Armatimonadetes bacterium]|nr:MarR family transcriptional regulator [Armatimonadota bacterium]
MTFKFTRRQGEYLAFIHHFTSRRGIAPSFEEIASHFGTSPPSVNGMIKTLEVHGLVSRVPGQARTLRVLVPESMLPGGDYAPAASRGRGSQSESPAGLSAADAAVAASISLFELLLPELEESRDVPGFVGGGALAVERALVQAGLGEEAAGKVRHRLTAEAARWMPEGRGASVRRQWTRG